MKFLSLLFISIFLYQIPIAAFAFQHNQNNITIRGMDAARSKEVYRQVDFYATYFDLKDVNILVSFSHQMPGDVEGFTIYEKNEITQTVFIKISSRLTFSAQELTLAHEMVHASQFIKGELIHHKDNHFTWKGREFRNIKHMNYRDRAWEEEAFKMEKTLLKLYRIHKTNMA